MTKSLKSTWIIITINLFIAAMIIVIMFDFESFLNLISNMILNLSVGIIGLYSSGYYFSNKMDYQINFRKRNAFLVGFIGLLLILLFGTFTGSSVGFLQEGISFNDNFNQIKESIFDYYYKPFFWILFFGIFPTIVTGIILGKLIKNYNNDNCCPASENVS